MLSTINNTSRNIFSNAILPGLSLALASYIKEKPTQSHFIITENAQTAERLKSELLFLLPGETIFLFPDLEILPFDYFSAAEDIISNRLNTLYHLLNKEISIVITSANTVLKYLPPIGFLNQHSFLLQVGEQLDLTERCKAFESTGYHYVNQVLARGEFSIRGSILDIFPMGASTPYRIDLFDNEVDSIRIFDVDTQRSEEKVDAINILPTQEFILDNNTLGIFKNNWSQYFGLDNTQNDIYRNILKKTAISGIEFYLTLFYQKTATIFDYLNPNTILHHIYDIHAAQSNYFNDIKARHDQLNHDRMRPILPVESVYLSCEKFAQYQQKYALNKWLAHSKKKSTELPFKSIDDIHIHYQYKLPYRKLLDFLEQYSFDKIIFSADSIGRREILLEHLNKLQLTAEICDTWHQALDSHNNIILLVTPFIEGLIIDKKTVLITEYDLFPNHISHYKRDKASASYEAGVSIKDLSELRIGAIVVHIEYGVARYLGLSKLDLNQQDNEFLILSFKNDEKLYVPIYSLHLVSRYSGSEIENPPLNKLGSETWEKQKQKAAKKINDVAAELLAIYAKRNLKKGFSHVFDEKAYLRFAEGFPFEATEDQQTTIDNVLKDMIADKPMDQLICGDVGFGKTEVAMRAAFVAVYNNKQVAILAPTTLLAQQHYDNFSDRFSEIGAVVDVLSRFKSATAQNEVIKRLKAGNIDIIIGTHQLLSDKIKFHNLGLLIIDEEHRFGVTHKEKMKAMRANIDILTMTATPIPRTLNMAFSSIRDLSIISTPPAKRLAVKTFIKQQNNAVIKEAVLRETLRGGQVYYLYNQVKNIDDKKAQLAELFPQYNIATAHGQMPERALEKVMFDFQQNRYHILVCTTIIETGIDIANVNTIIIERADMLGLAQLHQLRGRVGRSYHQAYAYLLTPPLVSLNKDAKKRLDAIAETDSLGGGFMLANHDLEIRGSGELLGKEQSGNIQSIGFNLYMELLQKTVTALKNGERFDAASMSDLHSGAEIELRIPALFPEHYIFDVHIRLNLYQRISTAETAEKLTEIKSEVIDRFGLMPNEALNLFTVAKIRLQANGLGIEKIETHSGGGKIAFKLPLTFNPAHLIRLVQQQSDDFQLNAEQQILIKKPLPQTADRIQFIENFIQQLEAR